jgi:hypothetical protein
MSDSIITINDLITAVNIIDVCTERGAIKGNELLLVGQLREKFAAFIKSNTPKENETNEVDSE